MHPLAFFAASIFALLFAFSPSSDTTTTISPLFEEHREDFDQFADFVSTYRKDYKSAAEFAHRFSVFRENLAEINRLNAEQSSFTLKINHFADLSQAEFEQTYLGYRPDAGYPRQAVREEDGHVVGDLPEAKNWVDEGFVAPVKDQGACGSCWAFSAVTAMESAYAIKHSLTSSSMKLLSEQQLVDCSGDYGNHGCNGGLMEKAFNYAKDNAMCSEDAYPYEAVDGECRKGSC